MRRTPLLLALALAPLIAGCLTTVGGGDGGPMDAVVDVVDMTPDTGPLFECPAPPPRPEILAPARVQGGQADRFLVRGRIVTPDQVIEGDVLVVGDRISCVGTDCAQSELAQGATIIETGGVIYPGLVDGHNHTQYNYLPPWPPPARFANRYQWQARGDYRMHVGSVNTNEGTYVCQQVKYGEIRALVGGTTTMQGSFNSPRRCFRTLVRNAEYGDFGEDRMRTNVGNVAEIRPETASDLRRQMDSGEVTAYVIHLAEGVDELSRNELNTLEGLGLLRAQTVIIHGTGLGPAELQRVATAGAKLVWSPLSNLVLYGGTTDVPTALSLGIPVALAPDWTPSGSPSLLQELRVARRHDCEQWGSVLSPQLLVQMVTSIAADVLGLGAYIGRVESGRLADLLVIADRGLDPYETLLRAGLADVRMVMIGGDIRYGDADIRFASPRVACEDLVMCGSAKFLCVADNEDGEDMLNESLAQIRAALQSFYAEPYTLEVCDEPATL